MKTKKKVLFICIHNSARSQMAEAFLNQICPDEFEAQSVGLEPGRLNPVVVEAMKDIRIDISGNRTQSVFDAFKSGQMFTTSFQSATKPVPKDVQFFRASPSVCTGAFPTRPVFLALTRTG